jgi:hypothetical protein
MRKQTYVTHLSLPFNPELARCGRQMPVSMGTTDPSFVTCKSCQRWAEANPTPAVTPEYTPFVTVTDGISRVNPWWVDAFEDPFAGFEVDPQTSTGHQFTGTRFNTLSDAIRDAKDMLEEPGVATVYIWPVTWSEARQSFDIHTECDYVRLFEGGEDPRPPLPDGVRELTERLAATREERIAALAAEVEGEMHAALSAAATPPAPTHTPGPWNAAASRVWASDSRELAKVWGKAAGVTTVAEQDANARLMAAAPELLAALEALVEAADATSLQEWIGPEIEHAKDVLAKACGEVRS